MSKVEMIVAGQKALVEAEDVKLHEKKAKLLDEARELKAEMDRLQADFQPTSSIRVKLDKKIGEIGRINKKMKPVQFL